MLRKRIAFVVEPWVLAKGTGVATFMAHSSLMCKLNGYYLDVITTPHTTAPCDGLTLFKGDNLYGTLISYLQEHKPEMIVAHTHKSTSVLNQIETEIPRYAYTHIGDLLDVENPLGDISRADARSYLALLGEITYPIATQSISTQERLSALLPDKEVVVLPEPYYTDDCKERGKEGLLIIGSHARRKRKDLMLRAAAETGLPVTVVASWAGDFDKHIKKAGIVDCTLLIGQTNDKVMELIKTHRVLLHFADLEFMPYSILEASPHLPCLVSNKAEWCKGELPCPVTKVNTTDAVQEIMGAYIGNYVGFDTSAYIQEFEGKWLNL